MNNFWTRAFTALVFVLLLFASVSYSHFTCFLIFFIFNIVGLWEFYSAGNYSKNKFHRYYGITSGAVLNTIFYFNSCGYLSMNAFLYFVVSIYTLFLIELFRKAEHPFENIAYAILGLIYVTIPFSLLHYIATSTENGLYDYKIIIGIFLLIWANDTGAYLIGSRFGKTKLFERISPKKSWEGSLGGVLLCILAAYVNTNIFNGYNFINWLVIAMIVAIVGTLGDLVESMFKRSNEIKDSGNLLPGHGGVLDRFDSLLLSVPFIYFYLRFVL